MHNDVFEIEKLFLFSSYYSVFLTGFDILLCVLYIYKRHLQFVKPSFIYHNNRIFMIGALWEK